MAQADLKQYSSKTDILRELKRPGDLLGAVIGTHDAPYMYLVKTHAIAMIADMHEDDVPEMWTLRVAADGTKWLNPAS